MISTKPQGNECSVNPECSGEMPQAIISDLIAAQVKSIETMDGGEGGEEGGRGGGGGGEGGGEGVAEGVI